MTIQPRINDDNLINLNINVGLSQFVANTTANTNTRTIITNANMADGEVLAIGGLMQDSFNSTLQGVPLLEKIPLVGWFFKNETKTKQKVNILIFVAPTIVRPHAKGKIEKNGKQIAVC